MGFSREELAKNLRRSARWHKDHCHDEYCGVSTYLLGEVYARLIGRELTEEELEDFL